jgi:pimeloyl-ACP methyl ester carboxylesterase
LRGVADSVNSADEALFPGFRRERVRTRETEIHAVVGGQGPPVLALHGYPQTHACWHRVAPVLAERFTVVCPDLRGYGDSGRPSCKDYRAGATVDLENDAADRDGRRIACPVLVLWGGRQRDARGWDPVAIWRDWARDVRGESLPCGHFLPEEAPVETLAALLPFLAGQ